MRKTAVILNLDELKKEYDRGENPHFLGKIAKPKPVSGATLLRAFDRAEIVLRAANLIDVLLRSIGSALPRKMQSEMKCSIKDLRELAGGGK